MGFASGALAAVDGGQRAALAGPGARALRARAARPSGASSRLPCCTSASLAGLLGRMQRLVSGNKADGAGGEAKKSDSYSKAMQSRMGGALTYTHEAGMNYAAVLPDLFVGSCLQTPADVDHLHASAGVATVLCLQEDSDMAYFSLDVKPIQARAAATVAAPGGPFGLGLVGPSSRAGLRHERVSIRDFDPFDLRLKLPRAVAVLYKSERERRGAAYVHCTAGLGRAPATAVAYMYWCRGFGLSEAYATLYDVRPCHPKLVAVRQATVDLLRGDSEAQPVTLVFPRLPGDPTVEVAGLDVGWGQKLTLKINPARERYELTRMLPPGKFPFKFIVGGSQWTYNADMMVFTDDGGNTNNYVEVARPETPEQVLQRERLLSDACVLTAEETAIIREKLRQMAP